MSLQRGVLVETVYFTPKEGERNRCLFIFLSGKWDRPESFETEGFVAAVRKAKLPVDMVGANAHLGYYIEKTFPERMKEDVITAAKRKGYEQIWRGMKNFVPRQKTLARVYLAYGLQDRFAFPDGVFAEVLPGGQVFTADGGHDWDTWRRLWERILNEFKLRLKGFDAGKK